MDKTNGEDRNKITFKDANTLNDVITLLSSDYRIYALRQNYVTLCMELGLSYFEIANLQRKEMLQSQSIALLLREVIMYWISARGFDKATVNELVDILQRTGLRSSADALSEYLQEKNDLSNDAYLNKKVDFLGKHLTLNEICMSLPTSMSEDILSGIMVDESTRKSMTSIDRFVLAKTKVPDELGYYISRYVSTTKELSILDVDLLRSNWDSSKHDDIFVFSGIRRHQLSHIAGRSCTETSGDFIDSTNNIRSTRRIHQFPMKFILLEDKSHRKCIKNTFKSLTCPLHFVDFQDGQYYITETHLSTKNLGSVLKESATEVSEEEFLAQIPTINDSICIVDTAGMGKTVMLAKIARELQKTETVLFIRMKSLFISSKATSMDIDVMFQKVSEMHSDYKLGQRIILELLLNHPVCLFLDGYDDIPPNDYEQAYEVLKLLFTRKNLRIFVTSRIHTKHIMEKLTSPKIFLMSPFTREKQVDFLCKYWILKAEGIGDEIQEFNIRKFAELCVDSIHKSMEQNERKIIGIPLQCKLLAEVYYKDAVRYITRPSSSDSDNYVIRSIPEMYEKYMDLRFHNGQSSDAKIVHVYHATRELFSEYAGHLEADHKEISETKLTASEICKYGILEYQSLRDELSFVHRTFAEYLLAEYIGKISCGETMPRSFAPLIYAALQTILGSHEWPGVSNQLKLKIHRFLSPNIAFFLNYHLKCETHDLRYEDCKAIFQAKREMLVAGVVQNLDNLSSYLLAKSDRATFSFEDVLNLAAFYCSTDLFKYLYTKLTEISALNWKSVDYTPLHWCLWKGNFAIYEYLSKNALFEVMLSSSANLLHACFHQSKQNPAGVINEKKEILELLLQEHGELINATEFSDNRTPLLTEDIHIDLILFLLDKNPNVTIATKSEGSTFLHKAVRYVSTSDLQEITKIFLVKGWIREYQRKNLAHQTPTQIAIKEKKLSRATAEMLLCALNCPDRDLVVGNEGCEFKNLVSIICGDDSACSNWRDLAWELEMSSLWVYRINLWLFLQYTSTRIMFMDMLKSWRSKSSKAATRNALVLHMRSIGWNLIADNIMDQFKTETEFAVAELEAYIKQELG